jgi:LuxR family maltose regulon positive regulatory protein
VAKVPREYSAVRSLAWYYLAAARQMTGDSQGAADTLSEGLREGRLHNNGFTTRFYLGFCMLHWLDAQLPALARMAGQMLHLGQERGLPEAITWGHYFLGCARYQQNDLAGAESEFAAVLRDKYAAHGLAASHSALGLASVYLAQGDHQRATAVTDEAMTYGLELGNGRVILDAEAFGAAVALRTGAIAEARTWALSRGASISLVPLTTFLAALESQAIVLAVAQPDSPLTDATLARLRDYADVAHNVRVQIEVFALEALVLDARGDRAAALTALAAALELAEPSRFIRIFVDLGRQMAALLGQLPTGGRQADYVQVILAAFVHEPAPHVPAAPAELIEPLSDRELEVLALLGNRLSNKEVAASLTISPMTVKRHAVNIYQKLAVGNRREAVLKAQKLGLLRGHP